MRAFLPIPNQAVRESVLEYKGMATVLDTRVVCVRPKIEGLRIFSSTKSTNVINGTISADREFPGQLEAKSFPKKQNLTRGYVVIDKNALFDDETSQRGFPDDWDEEWPVRLCNVKVQMETMQSELRSPGLSFDVVVPAPNETFPQQTYVMQAIVDIPDSVTQNPEGQRLSLCVYCTMRFDQNFFLARSFRLSPLPSFRARCVRPVGTQLWRCRRC
ncbi:hypothetical protein B0T16DRAFT_214446 [Cercophora newfieldiana]|uniref:Uncharacterized protein n=1 Tax=Cercophora newfieldiana TaxID=92897 RepID=A0AA40CK59_9PEZI|nr:hypothetical protein B0T16DRAFT_214446 [Cercophora newfieldiana]